MKSLAFILVILISSVLAVAAAKPEKQTVAFQGKQRTYYLFVPEGLNSPAPLLLLLHGAGRDGMSQIAEWKSLAEKERVILVAPNSAGPEEWGMDTDGPEFMHLIVEAVRARAPIDPRRIYLFGHSAGGVFALYMAVMESRYFAAVAVHAGALARDFYPYVKLAKRDIPITIWVGTVDRFFDLTTVKASVAEMNKNNVSAKVVEIPKHDHNYYAISKELNPKIWEFLHEHALDEEPEWQLYQ